MARSKKPTRRRDLIPDLIYGSRTVTRFINKTMRNGKKQAAVKQVYFALELLKTKFPNESPVKIFDEAIQTVAPKMEVRPRRVGGASYLVPSEVRGDRKIHLAMRWIIDAARGRSNKEFHTFAEKLVAEISDIKAGLGATIKKRDQVHKMAEANRAFAHFRW